MWVAGSSGTQKHKGDILVRAIEALRPAVRCSSYSEAPKSGGYNEGEREFDRGLLGAILWLVGGGVPPQRVRNRPSLAR